METSETGAGGIDAPDDPGSAPLVSVVIPAFNEASRIGPSIERIQEFLKKQRIPFEIVVVDDASSDSTGRVVEELEGAHPRVIRNEQNRGKGFSVRRGFEAAVGVWVLVTDADLSTPIEELELLFQAVGNGADVAIGSRAVDRRKILIHQSRFRELAGIFFNHIVRKMLNLDILDTQCGFKLFHRLRSAPVFERQTVAGFGFDPEILFLAHRLGLRIEEVPVRWSHAEGSKVRLLRDSVQMFLDLLKIRWNWMSGRYGTRRAPAELKRSGSD